MSSYELQLTHGDLAPLAGGAAGRHLGPRADSLTNGGARCGAALPSRPEVVSWRGGPSDQLNSGPVPLFVRPSNALTE